VFGAFHSGDFSGQVTLRGIGTVPPNVAAICRWTWECVSAPRGPNIHADAAGYGVINCPGPPGAGMVCLGQRGRACGLVEISDLLVLDVRLVRDAVREQTPGRHLIHYYVSSGKPVMLLGDPEQLGKRYRDDQVIVLQRKGSVSRKTFMATISSLEAMA